MAIANEPGMISFAGGLPNEKLFPLQGIKRGIDKLFSLDNAQSNLQYRITQGDPFLRKLIADRFNIELHHGSL